jgi:hypothetical protein
MEFVWKAALSQKQGTLKSILKTPLGRGWKLTQITFLIIQQPRIPAAWASESRRPRALPIGRGVPREDERRPGTVADTRHGRRIAGNLSYDCCQQCAMLSRACSGFDAVRLGLDMAKGPGGESSEIGHPKDRAPSKSVFEGLINRSFLIVIHSGCSCSRWMQGR